MILRAIEALPEMQRDVRLLPDIEGLTGAEFLVSPTLISMVRRLSELLKISALTDGHGKLVVVNGAGKPRLTLI